MAEEYIITLNYAQITRLSDKSLLKSTGVFCKIKYSHQEHKTNVVKSSLQKPEFKDTFRLKKVKMDDDLIIELYDWETQIKSDIICSAIFNLKGLKFKKNVPSSQDLSIKTGKTEKKIATIFFEIEYTREGLESEQEKEHKVINEQPTEEEKVDAGPPPKKREPLPEFELPKKEKKKKNFVSRKLLGNSYEKALGEFGDFNLEFENCDFSIDEKVKIAVKGGLNELGRVKPSNPVKFLGDFLLNYKEK